MRKREKIVKWTICSRMWTLYKDITRGYAKTRAIDFQRFCARPLAFNRERSDDRIHIYYYPFLLRQTFDQGKMFSNLNYIFYFWLLTLNLVKNTQNLICRLKRDPLDSQDLEILRRKLSLQLTNRILCVFYHVEMLNRTPHVFYIILYIKTSIGPPR